MPSLITASGVLKKVRLEWGWWIGDRESLLEKLY
jgi:hypothetical protein